MAAIISAYNDGSELVRKLRARRQQKKLAAMLADASTIPQEDVETADLEMSLTHGRAIIQRRYDLDYRSLGDRFATGDGTS